MIEKITEDELSLMECLIYPPSAISSIFSDLDNFLLEDENKFAEIRWAQEPVLSFEYMIDENPELSVKENFEQKIKSGSIECFGGRKWGKTYVVEKVDIFMSMFWLEGEHIGFTSIDALHIRGVLEEIITTIENHTLFKAFRFKVNRSPNYRITNKAGYLLESVNMNLQSRNPGQAFFQKHFKRLFIEEASLESEEVFSKRNEAISELGCVVRAAGMANFTKYSPAGRRFYNIDNKDIVCNLPQYVSPAWNSKEKKRAIEEHGGEQSLGYRIFVKGEVVEDGVSVLDMNRVRSNYIENKVIKNFEISKENFVNFRNIIVVDRPQSVEEVYIAADIGETAATEIVIVFKIKDQFYYTYNITCYNLTDKEQEEIFLHLASILEANIVALDTSIPPDEYVLIKHDNKIKNLQIQEIENLTGDIFVPTYKNDKLEWKKARLTSHFYKGKIKEFFVNPGNYKIRLTDNHSAMVYDKNGLSMKYAYNCKENDWFITPKNYNINNKDYCFLKYEEKKKNLFSKSKFKNIKLDESLAYILGWACAEGCSKTTNYQFALGNEKKEADFILKECRRLFNFDSGYVSKITKEYINSKKYSNKKATQDRYTVILGGGRDVLNFFQEQVGKSCYDKKIPEEIFNSPKSVQMSFIKGLLDGDGHIRTRISKSYCVKVSSQRLISNLITLLRINNIYPSYEERNDQNLKSFICYWSENPLIGRWEGIPYKVLDFKNGKNRVNKKLNDLKDFRISREKKEKFYNLKKSDWSFNKIKKIKEYFYQGKVYDLIVEDNHTFVAGIGNILCHNTDGTGRAIIRSLNKTIPLENLVACSFNEKLNIDFDRDKDGNVIFDTSGKPTYKQEYVSEWSVNRLKNLFYENRLKCPIDYKLDKQMNSVIANQSASRTVYSVAGREDHLFAAFRVLAIAIWQKEFSQTQSIKKKKFSKIGV